MFGKIRTSATVAAVAAAMVVCGAPAAHADGTVMCDMPAVHVVPAPGARNDVGEVYSSAVVAGHWTCASSDPGDAYWMHATVTLYAVYDGTVQMMGQASDSRQSVAGAASVHPAMKSPARPATWHYTRFSGSAGTRSIVANSQLFYVP